MPRLRSTPEDFHVVELPLYAPAGHGEHCWLEVEKRLLDSEEVAAALARAAGVDAGQVGFAGRKDREAVTRQWYSVPRLDPQHGANLSGEGWRVLRAERHFERLRVGELLGNEFVLKVREVDPGAATAAAERLAGLIRHGMPNRFGSQRFGRDGGNAERGAALLRGEQVAGGRRLQRLYLSALQAAVFNEVLARRPAPPHEPLDGELLLVHGSGALLIFHAGDEGLRGQVEAFAASPTGPLFGHKMRLPRAAARRREQEACAALGVPWVDALPHLDRHLLPGGRRPLRVPLGDAVATPHDGWLELRFRLPPGSYATVLVEELFPGAVTGA